MMQQAVFVSHYADYLLSLKQQGKSAHTLAAYRRDLEQLAHLLPQQEEGILSRQSFTAALKKLSQQGLNERSLGRKLSVWRQYGVWLEERGLADENPVRNMRAPKPKSRLPKAVREETVNLLLDQKEDSDVLSLRDHAIFELLYGSGLRLSELCGLDIKDIELETGWVSVIGKGSRQRQIPLTKKSMEAIKAYLPLRVATSGETALFVSKNGSRLGQRQIQKRLETWALKQGCEQHLSPHMMRHSYASHLLQASKDIRAVQELLGHSNLSTTQIYTRLDFDHLAAVYDAAHPRAKRKK